MMVNWWTVIAALVVVLSTSDAGGDGSANDNEVLNQVGKAKRFRGHSCSLKLYVDPYLWRKVYQMQGRDAVSATKRIKDLANLLVSRANKVFTTSEFYGQGRIIHRGIHFYLAKLDIDQGPCEFSVRDPFGLKLDCVEPNVPMIDLCHIPNNCSSRHRHNLYCNDIRTMRFYLHLFSQQDHGQYCLAYALTYRQMKDFQGIAWIKGYDQADSDTLHHFGYCAHNDDKCHHQSGPRSNNYFRNTGVINLQIVSGLYDEELASNLFVHELGHSLGANHDDDQDDEHQLPSDQLSGMARLCSERSRREGGFLMTSNATKIILGNTTFTLSPCSRIQIGQNLDKVTCWEDRRGPKKAGDDEDDSSCEYLRVSGDLKQCRRIERAKIGLLVVLCATSVIAAALALFLVVMRLSYLVKPKSEDESNSPSLTEPLPPKDIYIKLSNGNNEAENV